MNYMMRELWHNFVAWGSIRGWTKLYRQSQSLQVVGFPQDFLEHPSTSAAASCLSPSPQLKPPQKTLRSLRPPEHMTLRAFELKENQPVPLCSSLISPSGPRSSSGTLQISRLQNHPPLPSSPSGSCLPSVLSQAPFCRWTCHSSRNPSGRH